MSMSLSVSYFNVRQNVGAVFLNFLYLLNVTACAAMADTRDFLLEEVKHALEGKKTKNQSSLQCNVSLNFSYFKTK